MSDLQFAADQAPGGGERRLGVVDFITIGRTLDVDPLRLMTMLLSGGKGKSARAKRNT
jgi:hypothetical protein